METNDVYFLTMVLVAFSAFALTMVIASIQYRSWMKRTAANQQVANVNRSSPPAAAQKRAA